MTRLAASVTAIMAALAVAACGDISMNRQAKYQPQGAAGLFASTGEAQAPPAGAVAQDRTAFDSAEASPPPVTKALIERGRERHNLACRPCHGAQGEGDGVIVSRGFPQPLAYGNPVVRRMSGRALYDAIAKGYGVMYAQAERVEPADRWAIVAYIRALQIATPAVVRRAS